MKRIYYVILAFALLLLAMPSVVSSEKISKVTEHDKLAYANFNILLEDRTVNIDVASWETNNTGYTRIEKYTRYSNNSYAVESWHSENATATLEMKKNVRNAQLTAVGMHMESLYVCNYTGCSYLTTPEFTLNLTIRFEGIGDVNKEKSYYESRNGIIFGSKYKFFTSNAIATGLIEYATENVFIGETTSAGIQIRESKTTFS